MGINPLFPLHITPKWSSVIVITRKLSAVSLHLPLSDILSVTTLLSSISISVENNPLSTLYYSLHYCCQSPRVHFTLCKSRPPPTQSDNTSSSDKEKKVSKNTASWEVQLCQSLGPSARRPKLHSVPIPSHAC